MLTKSKPADAERLWKLAQQDVQSRYRMYEYMASRKTEPVAAANDAVEKTAPAAVKPVPTGATR